MDNKIRIIVDPEGFETTATLLANEAPETCRAIKKILPICGPLVHGMMSGNEVFLLLPGDDTRYPGPENWVYNTIPGDVLFWHSQWGEGKYLKDNPVCAEIIFIYGRYVRLRDLSHHEVAANLFATIDSKLEAFARICQRVRNEGPRKIRIEVVESSPQDVPEKIT
jgi:hypothetical protein